MKTFMFIFIVFVKLCVSKWRKKNFQNTRKTTIIEGSNEAKINLKVLRKPLSVREGNGCFRLFYFIPFQIFVCNRTHWVSVKQFHLCCEELCISWNSQILHCKRLVSWLATGFDVQTVGWVEAGQQIKLWLSQHSPLLLLPTVSAVPEVSVTIERTRIRGRKTEYLTCPGAYIYIDNSLKFDHMMVTLCTVVWRFTICGESVIQYCSTYKCCCGNKHYPSSCQHSCLKASGHHPTHLLLLSRLKVTCNHLEIEWLKYLRKLFFSWCVYPLFLTDSIHTYIESECEFV